jgi:hypothetical protein
LRDVVDGMWARFHFYHDYTVVFLCHDVDFVFARTPVAVADKVTFCK